MNNMSRQLFINKLTGVCYQQTFIQNKPGYVLMHPQGGGMQIRVPEGEFDTHFEPAPPPVWKKAYFTIDGMKLVVPGFTNGHLWNGWQVPSFERHVVDLLIAETRDPQYCTHHWKHGEPTTLIMVDEQSKAEGASKRDSEVEWLPMEITTDEGNTLTVYPFGDSWCWSLDQEEGPINLEALHADAGPIPQGNACRLSVDSGTVTLETGEEVNLLLTLLCLWRAYTDTGDQAYQLAMDQISTITGIGLDGHVHFVERQTESN